MTLREAVCATIRRLHDSPRTEEACLHWISVFVLSLAPPGLGRAVLSAVRGAEGRDCRRAGGEDRQARRVSYAAPQLRDVTARVASSPRRPTASPTPRRSRGARRRAATGGRRRAGGDRRAPGRREPSLLAPDTLSRGTSLDDRIRYILTCTYAMSGRNKHEAARRLEIDWRTVDKKIDHALLERDTKRPTR
jgi:hypothetical protein